MTTSRDLFKRARRVLPGGVSSPVRAGRNVAGGLGSSGAPPYIARAHGCVLTDVEGRGLIDYVGGWGHAILGHAHPAVVEAVERAVRDGSSPGTCTRGEVELAELIASRVPQDAAERVRFTNSGTEAVAAAVRLARGVTQRDLILTFDGNYHGAVDALLVRSGEGSGPASPALPGSAGVTRDAAAGALVARYNDLDDVRDAFARHADRIAGVIVEPVAGNMGLVPPEPGFLQGLREITTRHGALLIFDEVMTGFRLGPTGGGAQELFNIRPDLTTFGKIVGGGLPAGAVAGRGKVMDQLAPLGPVYHAGTFAGNPVTTAAGLATLTHLTPSIYERLEATSAALERGLTAALGATGADARVQRVGSMLSVFFSPTPVKNHDDAKRADHDAFGWLFRGMLDHGVYLPPSGYETWFVCAAHDRAAIDATIAAARAAAAEMVAAAAPYGL